MAVLHTATQPLESGLTMFNTISISMGFACVQSMMPQLAWSLEIIQDLVAHECNREAYSRKSHFIGVAVPLQLMHQATNLTQPDLYLTSMPTLDDCHSFASAVVV